MKSLYFWIPYIIILAGLIWLLIVGTNDLGGFIGLIFMGWLAFGALGIWITRRQRINKLPREQVEAILIEMDMVQTRNNPVVMYFATFKVEAWEETWRVRVTTEAVFDKMDKYTTGMQGTLIYGQLSPKKRHFFRFEIPDTPPLLEVLMA